MAKGQIILDTNNRVWLRWGIGVGNYIQHFSAMTVWNNKLILGGSSEGSLYKLDWHTITEDNMPIVSYWRSKNLDFGVPTAPKQIRKIVIEYRDSYSWAGETIEIYYRIDQAVDDFYHLPLWTYLDSILLGQTNSPVQTKVKSIAFSNLSLIGNTFQFELRAWGHIEVKKIFISFDVLSESP